MSCSTIYLLCKLCVRYALENRDQPFLPRAPLRACRAPLVFASVRALSLCHNSRCILQHISRTPTAHQDTLDYKTSTPLRSFHSFASPLVAAPQPKRARNWGAPSRGYEQRMNRFRRKSESRSRRKDVSSSGAEEAPTTPATLLLPEASNFRTSLILVSPRGEVQKVQELICNPLQPHLTKRFSLLRDSEGRLVDLNVLQSHLA